MTSVPGAGRDHHGSPVRGAGTHLAAAAGFGDREAVNERDRVRLSKLLSYHLRHDPAGLGLTLAPGGWAPVEAVLAGLAKKGVRATIEGLREVVATSDKQRFALDATGAKIRANQGHSVDVDLQLRAVEPPEHLYHGTGAQTVPAILREGLLKQQRHHVHLSGDVETARKVGARHGRPAVLVVAAAAMRADGFEFYRADNGVWLTGHVPPRYLSAL